MKYSSTVLFNPLNKSNIGNILMFYFHGSSYITFSIHISFIYSQKYCGSSSCALKIVRINRWPPLLPTLIMILRMSPFLISSTTASFLMRSSRSSPGPATWSSARCCSLSTHQPSTHSAWLLGFRPRSLFLWTLEWPRIFGGTDIRNEISDRMSITGM